MILSIFFIKESIADRADEMQSEATVLAIHKIKNTKKGDKPFVYEVFVRFESEFERVQQTSFISRRLPIYRKGERIIINYHSNNPLKVRSRGRKLSTKYFL